MKRQETVKQQWAEVLQTLLAWIEQKEADDVQGTETAGYLAAADGKSFAANPYARDTQRQLFVAWNWGWLRFKNDEREWEGNEGGADDERSWKFLDLSS